MKLAQERMLRELADAGQKSHSYVDGDKVYRATYVSADKVTIDEAGLKKAMGAAKWAKVVKPVLDRKKLEEAVANGEVSAELVGSYMQVDKSKPFVRFSEGVRKEGDDDADLPS